MEVDLREDCSNLKKVSVEELSTRLPLEAWFQIFNYLHITDKLYTSQEIFEFKEFYSMLQLYYPGYVDNFRNFHVERAAGRGLKGNQNEHWITQKLQPRVTFSLYLSQHQVMWLNERFETSDFRFLTFEKESSGDPHETYLSVNAICWLQFSVHNLTLPSGRFNVFYKMRGPSDTVRNRFTVSVQNNREGWESTGYIDSLQLQRLDKEWEWVPVFRDPSFTDLLAVETNFERGDTLTVELLSVNAFWTRGLCFQLLQFVAVDGGEGVL